MGTRERENNFVRLIFLRADFFIFPRADFWFAGITPLRQVSS